MTKKRALYPHSVKDIKGKVAIAELRRAHFIIVMLAVSLAFCVMLASLNLFMVDVFLGALLAALLIIVAAFSTITTIYLK